MAPTDLAITTHAQATTAPMRMAATHRSTLPIAKKTKIPPCGAREVAPTAIDRAPVTAPPAIIEGMTRSGSAAAKGIAPSEMKDAPSSQAATPFSRSASVNSFLRTTVAIAIAIGGTMPAAMTAAMIFSVAGSLWLRPAAAKA